MTSRKTGLYEVYSGSGASDNDLLFTTGEVSMFDSFMLHSSAGAVDVEVLLEVGGTWTTNPVSIQDLGAESTTPVLLTAAGTLYGFVGNFHQVRVRQNGATAATAYLRCWKMGAG